MPNVCDGKSCGTGIRVGGKYLCKHNNLAVRFPDIAEEWHPSNLGRPKNYMPGSSRKVWWKCRNNPCGCHIWKSRIDNRTSGKGCPFCNGRPCPHNNLAVKFPDLIEEWHPDNLGQPEDYSPGSHEKILWKCRNDPCGCHVWKAPIYVRVLGGFSRCPFCCNLKACSHNNLSVKYPDLAKEWHPDNPKRPEECVPGSSFRAKWTYEGHVWKSQVYGRTRKRKRKET